MTLDLAQYFVNLVAKEAKISHFSIKVSAGEISKMKSEVKSNITTVNGDTYLDDANYVLFFKKVEGWNAGDTKKLFELVNRALGKSANSLVEGDFKPYQVKSDDGEAEASSTIFLKITIR